MSRTHKKNRKFVYMIIAAILLVLIILFLLWNSRTILTSLNLTPAFNATSGGKSGSPFSDSGSEDHTPSIPSTSSPAIISGEPSVHLTIDGTEYNRGDTVLYTITSNRPSYSASLYVRPVDGSWVSVDTVTLSLDGSHVGGRTVEYPGIWEIKVTVDSTDSNVVRLTVKGVLLVVTTSTVHLGESFLVQVYSNNPDCALDAYWTMAPDSPYMFPLVGSSLGFIWLNTAGYGTGMLSISDVGFWDLHVCPSGGGLWSNSVRVTVEG